MHKNVHAVSVTDERRSMAIKASASLIAMCRWDGKFEKPIWLKPCSPKGTHQVIDSVAGCPQLKELLPGKKGKSQDYLIHANLRLLFPNALLELVVDATRGKTVFLDTQT